MTESVDISEFSFEAFVDFLFNKDVSEENQTLATLASSNETGKRDRWYYHVDVSFDAQRACTYYRRLFSRPQILLEKFSKTQLERGFWAIMGPNLDCSVTNLIWDLELPFGLREECVRSMFLLFRDLFADEPLETSVYMWWDSCCYSWHCGNRHRDRGGEDMLMQDVMFETLTRILLLQSEICQAAALHGVSHLHHPATEQLIQGYLAGHPSHNKEWREFALAAARFELM